MVVIVLSSIPGESSAHITRNQRRAGSHSWATLGFMVLSLRYTLKEPIYACVSIRKTLPFTEPVLAIV